MVQIIKAVVKVMLVKIFKNLKEARLVKLRTTV